jgi:hypothetical protein
MHLTHEVHEGELGPQDRWRAQIETTAQSSTKTMLSASSTGASFTVDLSDNLRGRSQISKCIMAST